MSPGFSQPVALARILAWSRLTGTLTQPTTARPHPAIVMVHGSGPVLRTEFQPLAEFFASFGVAVLAYDKRGVGGSSGQWQSTAYQELAGDALSALQYLQRRSDIRHGQIGMWGLSQGGWIIPLAASVSGDVAFIITVSGPGVTPTQQELWRVKHMLAVDGFSPEIIETALNLKRRGLALSQLEQREADWNTFTQTLERVRNEGWFGYLGFDTHPDTHVFLPEHQVNLDPTTILEHVTCPVLAIFGALDLLLPVELSAQNFDQALKTAGNTDYTIKIIPNGNHLIFEAITGSLREQSTLPGFVPQYLSLLRNWLQRHVTL